MVKQSRRGGPLSAAKVKSLLSAGGYKPDPELSRAITCSAYILPGGESLLVFETGKGVLYPNRDELLKTYLERVEKAKRESLQPQPILPDPGSFVERVPNLLAALPALIGIPSEELDRSESSLDLIDRAIRKLGTNRVLEPDVFSALAAYVGEVVRELTHGSWSTVLGQAGEAVPCIVDANGHRYFPSRMYKELLEYGRTASTRTFVTAIVGPKHHSQEGR